MFEFLKSNPKKKLEKEYSQKMEEAMKAQRNGNIDLYAQLTAEAENILRKIELIAKKI